MKPFELEVKRCSLTVKQALPAQRQATYKLTQHCWPTTPNIVGCYKLRPFAYLVTCCCAKLKPVKLLAPCKRTQHCWPITPNTVTSVCTQLYGILETGLLYKTRAYDWDFKPNASGHYNKCWELSPFARS